MKNRAAAAAAAAALRCPVTGPYDYKNVATVPVTQFPHDLHSYSLPTVRSLVATSYRQ